MRCCSYDFFRSIAELLDFTLNHGTLGRMLDDGDARPRIDVTRLRARNVKHASDQCLARGAVHAGDVELVIIIMIDV